MKKIFIKLFLFAKSIAHYKVSNSQSDQYDSSRDEANEKSFLDYMTYKFLVQAFVAALMTGLIAFTLNSCTEKESPPNIPNIINTMNNYNISEKKDSLNSIFLDEKGVISSMISSIQKAQKSPLNTPEIKKSNERILGRLYDYQNRAKVLFAEGGNEDLLEDEYRTERFFGDLQELFEDATGLKDFSLKHLASMAGKNLRLIELERLNKGLVDDTLRLASTLAITQQKPREWEGKYKGEVRTSTRLNNENNKLNVKNEDLSIEVKDKDVEIQESIVKIEVLTDEKSKIKSELTKKTEDLTQAQRSICRMFQDKFKRIDEYKDHFLGKKFNNNKKSKAILSLVNLLNNPKYKSIECEYNLQLLRIKHPRYYQTIDIKH